MKKKQNSLNTSIKLFTYEEYLKEFLYIDLQDNSNENTKPFDIGKKLAHKEILSIQNSLLRFKNGY